MNENRIPIEITIHAIYFCFEANFVATTTAVKCCWATCVVAVCAIPFDEFTRGEGAERANEGIQYERARLLSSFGAFIVFPFTRIWSDRYWWAVWFRPGPVSQSTSHFDGDVQMRRLTVTTMRCARARVHIRRWQELMSRNGFWMHEKWSQFRRFRLCASQDTCRYSRSELNWNFSLRQKHIAKYS